MTVNFTKLAMGTALMAASTLAMAASPATWPVSPSRLHLSTPFGTLNVAPSEYVYESRLRVDAVDVEPAIKGMLNITYAFRTPKAQIALVSINDGNNTCPISYRWVVLHASGYDLSSEFGSCSDQIQVAAKGPLLTLSTPSNEVPGKIDVYTYDGKTIKRRVTQKP
ncbi:hypothetical protein LKR43_14140 [Pusillimonas sp. MFBS29]|uniref:hypothetical protein n=1 Tax=Pusillimonas sp. MFBS29 TaxID=2886690 RepID=UPI001D1022BD|nr:hypothetical protein [Pusillimonas sp. MFBS29]MCC2597475.1 hypothetical protein [Pusillimonas sp. MFBS29]